MFCPDGGKSCMLGVYAGLADIHPFIHLSIYLSIEIRPLRPTCALKNSCLRDHVPLPGMFMNRDSIKLEIRNQTSEEAEHLRAHHLQDQDGGVGGNPKNSFSDSRAAAGGRGNEASGVVFRVNRKKKISLKCLKMLFLWLRHWIQVGH